MDHCFPHVIIKSCFSLVILPCCVVARMREDTVESRSRSMPRADRQEEEIEVVTSAGITEAWSRRHLLALALFPARAEAAAAPPWLRNLLPRRLSWPFRGDYDATPHSAVDLLPTFVAAVAAGLARRLLRREPRRVQPHPRHQQRERRKSRRRHPQHLGSSPHCSAPASAGSCYQCSNGMGNTVWFLLLLGPAL